MKKYYVMLFISLLSWHGQIFLMSHKDPLKVFVQKWCLVFNPSSEAIAKIYCEINTCLEPQEEDNYTSVLLTDVSEDDIFKSAGDGNGSFECPLLELKYILQQLVNDKVAQEFAKTKNKEAGKIKFFSNKHIKRFKKEKLQELKGLIDRLSDEHEAREAKRVADEAVQKEQGFLSWMLENITL